jgi:hypothetical protein
MPKLRTLFDGRYAPRAYHMSPIEDNYSLLLRLMMAQSEHALAEKGLLGAINGY